MMFKPSIQKFIVRWSHSVAFGLSMLLPGLLKAQSISFDARIPSEVAGDEGIFALISLPDEPRYGTTGAPVVIHVAGGFDSTTIQIARRGWSLPGFIEIRFNFPGGGQGSERSGGTYDDRGPNCLKALRDVGRYALGEIPDTDGQYLADRAAPVRPLNSNVGLVGWSNGGNATLTVAGLYGAEMSGLAWILNWESPVGDGMTGTEFGAHPRPGNSNPPVNPAYDPDTGTLDYSRLAYSDTLTIGLDRGIPLQGGLYFDINHNGVPDAGIDFVLRPLIRHPDGRTVAYYSVGTITAAEQNGLIPTPRPAHLPTVAETESYWRVRNGAYWFEEIIRYHPDLKFMVVAFDRDHVQTAPDHPHVLIQYEGMRTAGARFVRLNPDRAYVERVLGQAAPNAADNDAFTAFDHLTIRKAVEPSGDGGLPRNPVMVAALYELADRTQYHELNAQLDDIITAVADTPPLSENYRLYPVHPNPFNPAARLRFFLPRPQHAIVKVYNTNGKEVATLVDRRLAAGEHMVLFHAAKLPTGVYLFQLRAGSHTEIQKALLIR